MSTKLSDLLGMFTPELLQNYTSLRFSVMAYSPTAVIGFASTRANPDGTLRGVRMFEVDGGLAVQLDESSPTLIPTHLSDPKDYLRSLMQLIARHGGASNVPKAYADHLAKMGYRVVMRPWGNRDYTFETDALVKLPGKQFSKDRNYVNKAKTLYEYTKLGPDDYLEVLDFESKWREDFKSRNPTVGLGRINYLSNALHLSDLIPPEYRPVFLGARPLAGGDLLAVTNGVMVSSDTWGNVYGYVHTREMTSGALIMFHNLAKEYSDVPWENDGDAGGQTTGLVAFKDHFLTQSVAAKQQYFFIVKR